jgi:hypothetical protein
MQRHPYPASHRAMSHRTSTCSGSLPCLRATRRTRGLATEASEKFLRTTVRTWACHWPLSSTHVCPIHAASSSDAAVKTWSEFTGGRPVARTPRDTMHTMRPLALVSKSSLIGNETRTFCVTREPRSLSEGARMHSNPNRLILTAHATLCVCARARVCARVCGKQVSKDQVHGVKKGTTAHATLHAHYVVTACSSVLHDVISYHVHVLTSIQSDQLQIQMDLGRNAHTDKTRPESNNGESPTWHMLTSMRALFVGQGRACS